MPSRFVLGRLSSSNGTRRPPLTVRHVYRNIYFVRQTLAVLHKCDCEVARIIIARKMLYKQIYAKFCGISFPFPEFYYKTCSALALIRTVYISRYSGDRNSTRTFKISQAIMATVRFELSGLCLGRRPNYADTRMRFGLGCSLYTLVFTFCDNLTFAQTDVYMRKKPQWQVYEGGDKLHVKCEFRNPRFLFKFPVVTLTVCGSIKITIVLKWFSIGVTHVGTQPCYRFFFMSSVWCTPRKLSSFCNTTFSNYPINLWRSRCQLFLSLDCLPKHYWEDGVVSRVAIILLPSA